MIRLGIIALIAALLLPGVAGAANCSGNPFTLQNGQTADATQVMSNFNNLLTCANTNLAHNGANSDITSLSALSTPLSVAQGGTSRATLTAHNLLVGNTLSALNFLAPQTSGNLIVSNGTDFLSQALSVANTASAATTLTGTDTTQALTAGGFAGNKSLVAPGFYKFPGGLMIEWFTIAETGPTSGAVGFAFTFSTAALAVVLCPQSNPNSSAASASIIDKTQFTFGQAGTTGNIGYTVIAIGF